jgi:hypothetical protein
LLLNCGAKVVAVVVAVVAELAHTAARAEAMVGSLVQQVDRTGFCVHVLAIAIAHIAVYVVAHPANIPEFANATAALTALFGACAVAMTDIGVVTQMPHGAGMAVSETQATGQLDRNTIYGNTGQTEVCV